MILPAFSRVAAASRITAAAGLLAATTLAFGAPASAAASAPTLGGWNVSASAAVVDVLVDNQTGLAGIHPVDEAEFPDAESSFETGPFGSGLASILWPGSAGGNLGSLSGELGLPSQLSPLTSQLNDPVKAATQYPAGPTSASYPSGTPNGLVDMRSDSGADGTTAVSDLTDPAESGVLEFGSAKSTSSATASSSAKATSTSELSGISLLGLVGIASIQSTATAVSNGDTSSGSATTHISGVTVLGQPASIGSDGLVLPDFTGSGSGLSSLLGPLGPIAGTITGPALQAAVSQTVNALGLKITELPSTEDQNGPSDSVTSGGLSISVNPPPSAATLLEQVAAILAPIFPSQAAIIPTLPGLLQGATLTITLGQATASASASPAFDDSLGPLPAFGPPGTGTPTGSSTTTGPASSIPSAPTIPDVAPAGAFDSSGSGSFGGDSGGGGATGAGPSSPSTGAAPTTGAAQSTGSKATGSPSSGGSLPAVLVALSKPVTAGILAAGLAIALVAAYGLLRMARLVRAPAGAPTCPNQERK